MTEMCYMMQVVVLFVHRQLLKTNEVNFLYSTVCCYQLACMYAVSCSCVMPSVGGCIQECLENMSFDPVPLDVLCDVGIFEHVKVLQCMNISNPLEVCMASVCTSVYIMSLLGLCHTYN